MHSIPTLFVRDKETRTIINTPLRFVDWVFEGKGTPTRKYDGVAIKVQGPKIYIRFEWRPGSRVPLGFERLETQNPKRPDSTIPGWVPVNPNFLQAPNDLEERALAEAFLAKIMDLNQAAILKFAHAEQQREADPNAKPRFDPPYVQNTHAAPKVDWLPNGTYELCGPFIKGNPELLQAHALYLHGEHKFQCHVPRTFEGLKTFLSTFEGEGIVWHYKIHPGHALMTKIKKRDFGFPRRQANPPSRKESNG